MKRYLLFGGYDYYARGGWHDFLSSHDSLEEATDNGNFPKYFWFTDGRFADDVWWHVVDIQTQKVVASNAMSAEEFNARFGTT